MIVSIMGLIGSGKSSLTKALCEKYNYVKFMEPTSKSEGADDNPYLDDYYKDPSRWAFTMQVHLLWERYKQFQEAHYRSLRGEDCILDSSYYADFAFAIVQHEDGYFTEKEFNTYVKMHEAIQPSLIYPDVIIYLDLSPEDTLERIKKRSRDCEDGIPVEYLSSLNKAYSTVLNSLSKRCKVVRIDARKSESEVLADVENVLNIVKHELETSEHPCYK